MAKVQSLKQKLNKISYGLILTWLISFTASYQAIQLISKKTQIANNYQEIKSLVLSASMSMAYSQSSFRGFIIDPVKGEIFFDGKQQQDSDARTSLIAAKPLIHDAELTSIFEKIISADKATDPLEEKIQHDIKTDRAGTIKYFNTIYLSSFNKRINAMNEAIERANSLSKDALSDLKTSLNIISIVLTSLIIALVLSLSLYCSRLAKNLSKDLENLNSVIIKGATEVSNVSVSLAASSHDLSDSTTTQAAAIEETVSSMEEIGSMLSQTGQNASETLKISKDSQGSSDRGKTAITKLRQDMADIDTSNDRLGNIVNLIGDIRNKTRVINDIVSETRLLSFNASIEAARAGSHGRGFAVVAEEVGKLALMSGKAAEEIRTLLESGTIEVSQVVSTTQEKVSIGKAISEECEIAFSDMSQSLSQIGDSVRLISNATREQETGVKQTNEAMNEMDQLTQTNSTSIHSLALQATSLSSNASSLKNSALKLEEIIVGSQTNSTKTNKTEKMINLTHQNSTPKTESAVHEQNDAMKPKKSDKSSASPSSDSSHPSSHQPVALKLVSNSKNTKVSKSPDQSHLKDSKSASAEPSKNLTNNSAPDTSPSSSDTSKTKTITGTDIKRDDSRWRTG